MPRCTRRQQDHSGNIAQRGLKACVRMLSCTKRSKPVTPEQKLMVQALESIQAATDGKPMPAGPRSQALLQAMTAWYMDNVLRDPHALIKDG